MKETIPIESVLGTNRGFQMKILHSLLERFGSNFGMIELALIFTATIALILFAGTFSETLPSPLALFTRYKYGVSTKRQSRNLPEGIKARKMQYILALFAIINQANGFAATAKPVHHLRLIVVSLPEPDFLKTCKNISEPPKFTASESATIGSNPSNMRERASNAAVTKALDLVKYRAIVQALNAPFVKRPSTIALANHAPFVDEIMARNSTAELIFGDTNNFSNKLLPGRSRPLVRQRRNVAVSNSIGSLLPGMYPTSSFALMKNQAGAQMENMTLLSNAKEVKVASKVEAKRRSIDAIFGQQFEGQLAQSSRSAATILGESEAAAICGESEGQLAPSSRFTAANPGESEAATNPGESEEHQATVEPNHAIFGQPAQVHDNGSSIGVYPTRNFNEPSNERPFQLKKTYIYLLQPLIRVLLDRHSVLRLRGRIIPTTTISAAEFLRRQAPTMVDAAAQDFANNTLPQHARSNCLPTNSKSKVYDRGKQKRRRNNHQVDKQAINIINDRPIIISISLRGSTSTLPSTTLSIATAAMNPSNYVRPQLQLSASEGERCTYYRFNDLQERTHNHNKQQQQFRCAMCLILIIYHNSPSSINKFKLLSSGTVFRHKDTKFQTFGFQQVKKICTTTATMQAANNYSGKSSRLHLLLSCDFYPRPKLTITFFSKVGYGMSITKSSIISFQEFNLELFYVQDTLSIPRECENIKKYSERFS